jgi:hypothetical protein
MTNSTWLKPRLNLSGKSGFEFCKMTRDAWGLGRDAGGLRDA